MPDVLNQIITENYSLYNGDSCEIVKGIPDNSIHYTLFSPPFASLYTYSNSDRDMGNCRSDTEFYGSRKNEGITREGVSAIQRRRKNNKNRRKK